MRSAEEMREEVARKIALLFDQWGDAEDVVWSSLGEPGKEAYRRKADAILPLIRQAQAEAIEEAAAVIDNIIRIGKASPFWDANQVLMFEDAAAALRALKEREAGDGR